MFRSTKGASKQRRDLINTEISNLRDMLPLPESARQRLSQLQVMSLGCCYIRKSNYFSRLFSSIKTEAAPNFEFSQSMTGFLLITTREGKLLYISENVTEYLGHSMVDMLTQGDSLYDIIDKRDHSCVQSQLNASGEVGDERTFFCKMNVARSFRRQAGFGDHKVMHVSGRFVQPIVRDQYANQPVFLAVCSPMITPDVKDSLVQHNTMIFQSVHGLDMKFTEVSARGEHHLGYTNAEMAGKSWYELIHPEDIQEAKEKHIQLVQSSHEMGCMLTVRLQAKGGDFIWVNVVMKIRQPFICDNGEPAIVCINQVISEYEAQHFKAQSQLYSSHVVRSPEFMGTSQCTTPPHTIQHVAPEQEQLPTTISSFSAMLADQTPPPTYFGEFSMAIAGPVDSSDAPKFSLNSALKTSQSTMSDSGSDRSCSPSQQNLDPKQLINHLLMKKLKRKFSEAADLCKPTKLPRYSSSNHGSDSDSGTLSVHASAVFAPSSTTFGSSNYNGGGNMMAYQVMAPLSTGHSFTQLSLKNAVDPVAINSLKTAALLRSKSKVAEQTFAQPMTPPSPTNSSISTYGEDTKSMMTKLTVDINDQVIVPSGMLTPESSPTYSPASSYVHVMSPSEQCVPTDIADLEDSIFSDIETDSPQSPAKPQMTTDTQKSGSLNAQFRLPVLDASGIEEWFNHITDKSDFNAEATVFDQQCTSPSSTIEDALSYMSGSPSAASPQCEADTAVCEDMLDEKTWTDDQFNDMICTVTDTIMNMVHSVSKESSGVIGNLLRVKEEESTVDGVMNLEDMCPPAAVQNDLLNELHQLNQLAGSIPSYGEQSMNGGIFEQQL